MLTLLLSRDVSRSRNATWDDFSFTFIWTVGEFRCYILNSWKFLPILFRRSSIFPHRLTVDFCKSFVRRMVRSRPRFPGGYWYVTFNGLRFHVVKYKWRCLQISSQNRTSLRQTTNVFGPIHLRPFRIIKLVVLVCFRTVDRPIGFTKSAVTCASHCILNFCCLYIVKSLGIRVKLIRSG